MRLPLRLWEENNCACSLVTSSSLGWEQVCLLEGKGSGGMLGPGNRGLDAPETRETQVCGGDREDQRGLQVRRRSTHSPQRLFTSKCLIVLHFFTPEPKEALETLTEWGSPMVGNSPVPPT